tara:strand:+ start:306 stop:485 length:180 start_codon:yes stop_codon:yes gene_type:complete
MIDELEYKNLVLSYVDKKFKNQNVSSTLSLAKEKGLLDKSENITYAGLTLAEMLKLDRI